MANKRSVEPPNPLPGETPFKKVKAMPGSVGTGVDVFEDDEVIELNESGRKIKAVKSFLDCHVDLYGPFSYDMGDLHDYIVEIPVENGGVEDYKSGGEENVDPLDVQSVRDAIVRRRKEREEAKVKAEADKDGAKVKREHCDKCALLGRQRASLSRDLLATTSEVNRLQELVDNLEGRLNALIGKHEKLDAEATEMRTELEAARIENAKLRGENIRLEEVAKKVVTDAERYRSESDVLRKTAAETSSSAAKETKTLADQLSKSSNEARRLQIELQAAQKENGTLRAERLKALNSLEEMKQAEKKLEDEYGSYGDRVKELSQENKQLEEGFSSAKKKYQSAKSDLEKMKKDYENAKASRSNLEGQISSLKKTKSSLEAEVSSLKKAKINAETNHNILLKSHHSMKKDLDEVTAHLQDMCSKNSDLIRALEDSAKWKKQARLLHRKFEKMERNSKRERKESSSSSDSSDAANDVREGTEDLEDILKRLTND